MTLLGLILVFVVVGVVLWLINTYVPMAPLIKTLMNVAVVIILVVWLIQSLGLLGPLNIPLRVR
jgi:hypothetical protein